MSDDIQVLICFRNPSRYSPARCGRFISAEDHPGLHVLDGRAMSLEEYESQPENFLAKLQTGGHDLQVKVLRPKPVAVPTGEPGDDAGEGEPEPVVSTEQALADARNKQQVIDLAAKHGLTLDPKMTRREMEDALLAHLAPDESDVEEPSTDAPEIDPTDPTDLPPAEPPAKAPAKPAEPPADDIWGDV